MINSNFGFTPLKEVWLGACYPESFFDHLPNEIADPFRQIVQWTQEDTNKLQTFLESRGILVRRPIIDKIEDYLDEQEHLKHPPISPRNNYLVLGQTLYSLHKPWKVDPWQHWLDHYRAEGYDVQVPKNQPINCLCPPSLVRIGRDLYLDADSHPHVWGFMSQWMVETARDYRVNICSTSGHSDGVFCPVAPGLIVSSHYKADYAVDFPSWEVFRIPSNLHNFQDWQKWRVDDPAFKADNKGAFNRYIQECASDWVGNFQETVFEVNMLVLDEHNVVCMKNHEPLAEWLSDRGVTMHLFDFRTRSFWDGGWHCLTLDIHREDHKADLFPERGENGVYWRSA